MVVNGKINVTSRNKKTGFKTENFNYKLKNKEGKEFQVSIYREILEAPEIKQEM